MGWVSSLEPGACDGLLAVTEYNQLALWDMRAAEKNGCVRRLPVNIFSLLSLLSHQSIPVRVIASQAVVLCTD